MIYTVKQMTALNAEKNLACSKFQEEFSGVPL